MPNAPGLRVRSRPRSRPGFGAITRNGWRHAFAGMFGGDAAEEGAALSVRAPVDLRVNTLKASRDKVLKALARFEPQPTAYAASGLRIAPRQGPARIPNLEADAAHGKGWLEVQDEGSQIAALVSGAGPRLQVIDLCAGAGGKTLALAATMQNTGQLYAYDTSRMRLRPIFERLRRAGVRNVQVLGGGGRGGARGARGQDGPRGHRCPLYGLGNLAAAARCQMAFHTRDAVGARGRSSRGA